MLAVAMSAGIAPIGETAAQTKPAHRRVPDTLDGESALASLDRGLAWLVRTQHSNGSWASGVIEGLIDSGYSVASFYDWQLGAHAIACMALGRAKETPERRRALERGIRWLTKTRLPRRGSDWDNDTVWAALYGTVACIELLDDPRFNANPWRRRLEDRGRKLLRLLIRNQVPAGGWAYYDDPPYSRRPKWGTSFCTALIVPTLLRAKARGWFDDQPIIDRAVAYVRRCRLPNGAFEYDLNPIPRAPAGEHINKIKGSLSRIQVGLWALRLAGDAKTTDDRIRTGLEAFYKHHRFLDIARMRPVPHEAYYANAGYFYFFGHFYAGEVINLLPEAERDALHARLRPHIVKTQRTNGSFCDFLGQGYLVVAGTAYACLALESGLLDGK